MKILPYIKEKLVTLFPSSVPTDGLNIQHSLYLSDELMEAWRVWHSSKVTE